MYKFSFYLDRTFKKGVSELEARELKKQMLNGKNVKKFLNDRPTAIYIGATINGKYFKVKTDEKILPAYWDSKTQSVKPNHVNAFEFNADLTALKSRVDLAYRNSNNQSQTISELKVLIKKIILGNTPKNDPEDFSKLFLEFLEYKRITIKKGTIDRYKTSLTNYSEFQKATGTKFIISQINKQFIERLMFFLGNEKKKGDNHIAKIVTHLLAFLRWAKKKEIQINEDVFEISPKSYEPEVFYLTERELMTIYNKDFGSKKLNNIRDTFCFMCLTGQRRGDYKKLKQRDIKTTERGLEWHLYQGKNTKTKKVIIPLSKLATSILDKYRNEESDENALILPIISDQKTNDYIKDLCRLSEINETVIHVKFSNGVRIETPKKKYEVITSHVARKTFVTLSLEKGMRPEVVQGITGHESYKVMRRYIKISDSIKNIELSKAWD